MMRLTDENIHGRTVLTSDGLAIGEITALFIDSHVWGVESLQVKLRKEMADRIGADRGLFHAGVVEIPVGMVQSVGDAIILSVPVDSLRSLSPPSPSTEELGPNDA